MNQSFVKLIECPRDAMQGWKNFIPTEKKIEYINALLKVGFDTIDFGSFVSSRAIPQMADTKDVIGGVEPGDSRTKLLAIVANVRGAQQAGSFDKVACMGFPFSVSETFQQRNTNSSIDESWDRVEQIQNICVQKRKQLIIYMSMGFGNPYNDPYSDEIVFRWVKRMADVGVTTISLADTIGLANPGQVYAMTKYLIELLPGVEIGVHLHSRPDNWLQKLEAAVQAGCKRFD